MSRDYKNLFTQGQIGKMQLKNRIVMPPMGTGYHDEGGRLCSVMCPTIN